MDDRTFEYARGRVSGPATALIVVSAISSALLLLALAVDIWLLVSGVAGEMAQPRGMPKETQVTIRAVWAFLMLATGAVILIGAVRMMGLRSRGLSMVACVLALVPCLGPCFVLGIPFGIWGLVALNDPRVRRAFES
jgi:hypothetical protein